MSRHYGMFIFLTEDYALLYKATDGKVCGGGGGAACGGALLLQLEEVRRRVVLRDWSALMDTTDAVVHAAVVLLAVTVLLDLLAVLIHRSASPAL